MRRHEITHPYVTEIRIDPAQFFDFKRLTQDAPEIRLISCDDSEPDLWTLRVACASEEVARRLQRAW